MKSIPEIRKIVLECVDPDNFEDGKRKFQALCTPEEIKAMKDFNMHYRSLESDVMREYKLGIITKKMKRERTRKIREERQRKLNEDEEV